MAFSLIAFLLLTYFGPPLFAEEPDSPGASDVLTTLAQIRGLPAEEAAKGHSVEVEAIVTFRTHDGNLFVHDYKEGIYVARRPAAAPLAPGQVIHIHGHTAAGDYAPIVKADVVEPIRVAPLPQPRRVSFDELSSSSLDCEWVEVEGVIRSAVAVTTNRYEVEMAVEGGRLRIYLLEPPPDVRGRLVDATVRMQGARGCIFNQKRQSLGPLLFVDGKNLQVIEPAPEEPYAAPTRPINSLLQFAPGSRHGHRIKIRGTVTHQIAGEAVFVRDEGQGLLLRTVETTPLAAGDVIEAIGFETVGKCAPFLEDSSFRNIGHDRMPPPVAISSADAMSGTFEANLVRLRGKLLDSVQRDGNIQLVLESDNVLLHAELPITANHTFDLQNGSELELTGICLVQEVSEQRSIVKPQSVKIVLRSAGDITLLRSPPWWTPQRLTWSLLGVTAIFVGGFVTTVIQTRRKARQQEGARQESESHLIAIMAERNRMAREIHDTLAQGFTAISVQLEALKDKVGASPQAAKHLELARTFVRSSLAEARRSIWDMRSQALEEADLPTALSNVARQLTSGASIEVDLVVRGDKRRLPTIVENNLLRIGQEAITNAIKHANPTRIVVEFHFTADSVILRVKDNGRGFDSTVIQENSNGRFGLVGMRERVQPLSARLTIKSEIGRGTEIEVEAPAA